MGSTDSECYKTEPFDRRESEPLDVAEGDRQQENVLVFDLKINIYHVDRARFC